MQAFKCKTNKRKQRFPMLYFYYTSPRKGHSLQSEGSSSPVRWKGFMQTQRQTTLDNTPLKLSNFEREKSTKLGCLTG